MHPVGFYYTNYKVLLCIMSHLHFTPAVYKACFIKQDNSEVCYYILEYLHLFLNFPEPYNIFFARGIFLGVV